MRYKETEGVDGEVKYAHGVIQLVYKASREIFRKKWTLYVLSIITFVSIVRLFKICVEFAKDAVGISASSTKHAHTIIRADIRTQ